MRRIALGSMLLLAAAYEASAAGVVRIANGDCAGLQSAVTAAVANGPATNILLANRGSYAYCPITATGNLTIDGRGATLQVATSDETAAIHVTSSAHMTVRNMNFVATPTPFPQGAGSYACGFFGHAWCGPSELPVISNDGELALDSVSLSGVPYDTATSLIASTGTLTMRNTSVVNNDGNEEYSPTIANTGHMEIFHSTLSGNRAGNIGMLFGDAPATTTIANSILVQNGGPNCHSSTVYTVPAPTSLGGNVSDDTSCAFHNVNDRVVADAKLGAFDTHGSVVHSVALNYDSPAIGNGVAANCEAADVRGAARGLTSCDSGAYEFGGGQGKIGVSGTSGLYFNHENNGHYVTVQRVFDDNVLVIWNTFDEQGKQAWLYGVGAVNGGHVHVDQVAQNLGGTLQPGGAVDGVTATSWGTFDLDVGSCYTATLNYHSALPQFGDGSVNLDRLAFVNGLDCSP